ncbi:adenylate/guanylate cyclase domain-containing protein [Thermodesulfobacteriota bacterium]
MIIHYSLPLNPPKRFETESNSITLGRKPRPDQQIDLDLELDEYISKVHACITYENGEYWIEDLGSANGTWVNGRKIEKKTRFRKGDKVQMGWTMIEAGTETPPPAPDFVEKPMDTAPQIHEPELTPDSPTFIGEFDEAVSPIAWPDSRLDAPTFVGNFSEAGISVAEPDPEPDTPLFVEEPVETEPPSPEPKPITEPEGIIVDLTDVTTPSYAVSGEGSANDRLTQAWKQLTGFNDLCNELGTADSLDSMVQILIENLKLAIPNAQRGAVLLPDKRGELLLKAHWPPGDHSVSGTWINRAYKRREHFVWAASEDSDLENNAPQSALYYKVQSAIYVPLLSGNEVLGVMYVDNHYTREAFAGTDLELMRAIANQVAMFIRDHVLRKDLQREEKIRSDLSRQFPPKIAQRILGKGFQLRIGGERVDPVTILVSDVRSFTALSAKMAPDDVVRMLNEMFDAFVPIIFEYDGVVDKYVGDSVLAVFGSPEKDDQQCEKAVQAALEMQQAVQKLGEGRRVRRLSAFDVGISVHTGEAIHGFIGSTERMEYTVIGDTVNQASRFCDGADSGEVVISKSVYERIYHLVEVESKTIRTKHPEIEPDLEAYVVKKLKKNT